MKKHKIVAGALAVLSVSAVQAQQSNISYTNIEFSYQMAEVLDQDYSGFGIAGSAAINESVYARGSYSTLTSDDELSLGFGLVDEVDVNQLSFGLGFHTPLDRDIDFFADLSFAETELEAAGGSIDGDGYLINSGIRGKPADNLEFGASVNYADIEDEGETGFAFYGRFFASPQFSLGVAYGSSDDVDTISLSARIDI